VNGDEVRCLILPRAGSGYDSASVGELLDQVAAELDAGRPAAPLIAGATFPPWSGWPGWGRDPHGRKRRGYDCAAVDGVLAQLRRQDDPAARADPWRDLPAWHYYMARPDAGAADPVAAWRRVMAPPAARMQAAKDYARACADAWRGFALVPGTQLSLVKTGAGRHELRDAKGHALASARSLASSVPALSRNGRTYTLGNVTKAQWPAVAAQLCARHPGSPAHLQSTPPAARAGKPAAGSRIPAARSRPTGLLSLADRTGPPVLYASGSHYDHDAGGVVEFPGQRWLRFPVRGSTPSDAIMTAVDQAGRPVARYRITSHGAFGLWRAIDITVHPGQPLTDELLLTLIHTAGLIIPFFNHSSGGG
jgi:hypothetical protein